MRIVHVVDNYPPTPGGMERAVQALARAQAALGHDVRVVALAHPDLPDDTTDGDVRVRRFAGYTRHLRRLSNDPEHQFHPTIADPQLVRRIEALLHDEPADVVHAHGWIVHSAMAADRGPDTALLHTLHDYGLTCATKTMVRDQRPGPICDGPALGRCVSCSIGFYGAAKGVALTTGALIGRRRHGRAGRFPSVDLFLPISRAVADACLVDVDPERIRVVPSFVPDDLLPGPGPRPEFLPDGDFVLFVGQLGPHKGIDVLLDAHRRMTRAVPLVIIGSRRPDSPEIAGTAERPVEMLAGLDHGTIMRCYAAATVCAVPSRWAEPFGLVAVESMAAGTPVVASDIGGLAEVIGDGCSGFLVTPGRPDDLAAALDMVLAAEPALLEQVSANGRFRAAEFTSSAVLPAVFDAYEAALARRGAQLDRATRPAA